MRRRIVPRITVRMLMVIVAVAALVPGVLIERYHRFRRIADYHQAEMLRCAKRAVMFGGSSEDPFHRRMEKWHLPMMEKYREAARHPWLPVEPDPPEPAEEKGSGTVFVGMKNGT